MKVLFTRKFFPEDINYIRERLVDNIEIIIPEDYNESTLMKYAPEAEVFFGGYISRLLLNAAKKLAFIQIPWTGVDNLDFDLLREKNVTLCNSHSNALIVAEHAVAMMLDAAKRLSYHDRMLRQGYWNRLEKNRENEISPFSAMVSNSNVCIIGFGAIGSKIAELLGGFKCKITAITKGPVNFNNSSIVTFSPSELSEGLRCKKFVFVSVPLTPETRNLVNDEFFASMDSDAILINISRGEVIDEKALYYALFFNKIAFAAIDTWYNYPSKDSPIAFPSINYPFHNLNNLILSPHRAGYCESGFPHLDDAINNLNAFAKGEKLNNIVNLNLGY
jgi:phosphoglycerate dehydrogenase-like enzyme